ncbi:DUF3732 domain-containing protein [Chryseobacterium sp.]|uniref:DUF3732 domain-containing protein n=1 Tax=Chryseobacterium sp. TaxID=1871047 RepID=UPI0025C0FF84|nr:DUF3732 domain-containing protein [Chryseobacterium sp.]MBV8328292.1 DUF3732 domain-containing protein [Chryseobacterium sp.]
MKASISHIFLFNGDQVRNLKFEEGLNIITGDSKTGKSAVIEIIDYCLFASRSTIPKGIITDWTEFYCIVLKIMEKFLVIARKKNSNSMYFVVEIDPKVLENFSLEYFSDKSLMDLNDAKKEFEKHLGISVLDTRTDIEEDKRTSGGKVTMRSFAPFIFQHQNLIANKHSLFYRFDDFYKRKKTIDDYSILMGWENAEYFDLRRELEEKQKELSRNKKIAEKLKINSEQLRTDLYNSLSIYYTFLGKNLDSEISLSDLKKLSKDLPKANANSVADQNLPLLLGKIDHEITEKKKELINVENLIDTIKDNNSLSKNYGSNIKRLKAMASIPQVVEEIHCPLCEQEVKEIKEKINIVQESNQMLVNEFEKIGVYVNDTSEESGTLRKQRDQLKKEIKSLSIKAEEINNQITLEFNSREDYEKGLLLKGRTEATAATLIERSQLLAADKNDFTELIEYIEELKSKLSGYNLKEKLQKAEVLLSEKMSEICNQLDFEDEFKPGKIWFDLEKFALKYTIDERENILLSEMGSGSNWLAIHLSAFLGFLYLHSVTESSRIPSILILDQPSQVYFPKVYGKLEEEEANDNNKKDDNILQVKNIFKVLSHEITTIESECGFKPQIIVLEHADEEEFSQFIKYRWSKEGSKLI